MATRYIDKPTATGYIRNFGNAAGWGYVNGKVYVNGDGVARAMATGYDFGQTYFVDGDAGADTNDGKDPGSAFATIAAAISAASDGDTIIIRPLSVTAGGTDPVAYAENLVIPAAKSLRLIGIGTANNGNQPHLKVGATTTQAILTIRSPGCTIAGLTFNGAGATGGGILLDDDGSTKTAFGTTITDCYFRNCKGSAAAATGGAIQWASTGGAWHVRISGNHFTDNRAGITLLGTSQARPRDVVIEDNTFSSNVNTAVDADIYFAGGSGADALVIRRNDFATVDVPAYATSPTAARYLDLTGCEGLLAQNTFACKVGSQDTPVTFGAAGSAAKIPTTVRMALNFGEVADAATANGDVGHIHRT